MQARTRTRTRTNTFPDGTEANAAGICKPLYIPPLYSKLLSFLRSTVQSCAVTSASQPRSIASGSLLPPPASPRKTPLNPLRPCGIKSQLLRLIAQGGRELASKGGLRAWRWALIGICARRSRRSQKYRRFGLPFRPDRGSPPPLQTPDLIGFLHPWDGRLGPTWIYPFCYHCLLSAHDKDQTVVKTMGVMLPTRRQLRVGGPRVSARLLRLRRWRRR